MMNQPDQVNEQLRLMPNRVSTETHYANLGPSESVLVQASAQILSALIASGNHHLNDNELVDKAVGLALSLANKIERAVQDSSEVPDAGGLPK